MVNIQFIIEHKTYGQKCPEFKKKKTNLKYSKYNTIKLVVCPLYKRKLILMSENSLRYLIPNNYKYKNNKTNV